MREIRQSGSEGGVVGNGHPYPYPYLGGVWVRLFFGRFVSAALQEHAKPCLARATIQVSPPVSPIHSLARPSPPYFPL